MLRKICNTLLCLAVSYNVTTSYAMGTNAQRYTGISIEYKLNPNEPQLFVNYFFSTLSATCKVSTEDNENQLQVVGLARKGKVNDMPLTAGTTLYVTVKPNELIKLSADSGAKVQITNLGEHTVTVNCTT